MPVEQRESVPHNYSAQALWDYIIGYTPGDFVDIKLTDQSQEKIRIVAMHAEWRDELFLTTIGQHLEGELEKDGLNHEFLYYFMAGPVSRFEAQHWADCVRYVDKQTLALFQKYDIHGYRKMPEKVYDLAFGEAMRTSWKV